MKIPVSRLDEREVKKRYPIEGKISGWFFRVEEVSNSVWEVEGTDLYGRIVSRSGVDPDVTLEAVVSDAKAIG